MTDLELQEVFKKRFPKIRSHIIYYSEGKEDRRQDALLGAWQALRNDNNCTDRYLKNGAKFGINIGSRTKSVDSKGKTAGKRKDLKIFSMDALEADAAASLLEDKSLPIDEVVSDKISFERFIERLSDLEKKFVKARLIGLSRDEIYRKLKIGQLAFLSTRRNALAKFKTSFDCV